MQIVLLQLCIKMPNFDGPTDDIDQHPVWQWQGKEKDFAMAWKCVFPCVHPLFPVVEPIPLEMRVPKLWPFYGLFPMATSFIRKRSGQEAVASFWSNPKVWPWRCRVLLPGQGPDMSSFLGQIPKTYWEASQLRPPAVFLGKLLRMILT